MIGEITSGPDSRWRDNRSEPRALDGNDGGTPACAPAFVGATARQAGRPAPLNQVDDCGGRRDD